MDESSITVVPDDPNDATDNSAITVEVFGDPTVIPGSDSEARDRVFAIFRANVISVERANRLLNLFSAQGVETRLAAPSE